MPTPAHILKSATDEAGNLLQQCTVRVYEAGTTSLVGDPFYSDAELTTQLANPYLCLSGVIDLYFDGHHSVRVGVTPAGETQEMVFDYIDTMDPPEAPIDLPPGFAPDDPATIFYLTDGVTVWGVTVDDTGHLTTTAVV